MVSETLTPTLERENEILALIPSGFIKINSDCEILKINSKAKSFLGIDSYASLMGQRLTDYIDNIDLLNNLWHITNKGWKDMYLPDINIDDRSLIIYGKILKDNYIVTIIDNTTTSKALDKATQSLLIGQEKEKRRIAREIHDGIGQAISTVRLHLDFMMSKMNNPDTKRDAHRISNLISEIATDLRNLSHDLMPSSLVDFGLITALTNLIKRVNQTQSIYVYLENDILNEDIDFNYSLNIYRIIQELINNSIKHSDCKEVKIKLNLRNDIISLVVSDDGRGSDKVKVGSGIGLYNIKNRLASINGQLEIKTSKFKGFKVIINIPFNNSKPQPLS